MNDGKAPLIFINDHQVINQLISGLIIQVRSHQDSTGDSTIDAETRLQNFRCFHQPNSFVSFDIGRQPVNEG